MNEERTKLDLAFALHQNVELIKKVIFKFDKLKKQVLLIGVWMSMTFLIFTGAFIWLLIR